MKIPHFKHFFCRSMLKGFIYFDFVFQKFVLNIYTIVNKGYSCEKPYSVLNKAFSIIIYSLKRLIRLKVL